MAYEMPVRLRTFRDRISKQIDIDTVINFCILDVKSTEDKKILKERIEHFCLMSYLYGRGDGIDRMQECYDLIDKGQKR